MQLAQLNVAFMRGPIDSPLMATFVEQIADVNASAESSPGFVWRLKDDDGPGALEQRILGDDTMLVNLSVWRDLDSLREFVLGDVGHRTALQSRREWFERSPEFMTVCWPVDEGHRPTLEEAEARLLELRTTGPHEALFPFTYRD
jgi:hypothetical protein